jgi:hypothetical protein
MESGWWRQVLKSLKIVFLLQWKENKMFPAKKFENVLARARVEEYIHAGTDTVNITEKHSTSDVYL